MSTEKFYNAIDTNNLQQIKKLCENSNIDSQKSILRYAVNRGHYPIFKYLFESSSFDTFGIRKIDIIDSLRYDLYHADRNVQLGRLYILGYCIEDMRDLNTLGLLPLDYQFLKELL